jgi:hypothetical protein
VAVLCACDQICSARFCILVWKGERCDWFNSGTGTATTVKADSFNSKQEAPKLGVAKFLVDYFL